MTQNHTPPNNFCKSCGTSITQEDRFCRNCGNQIIVEIKNDSSSNQAETNNVLNKYKPGITLFSALTFFMLLFPPIEWGTKYARQGGSFHVKHTGFYFLLSFSDSGRNWGMGINEAHINILQLFVQIILVAIISVFFQYYNVKIKKWLKDNI